MSSHRENVCSENILGIVAARLTVLVSTLAHDVAGGHAVAVLRVYHDTLLKTSGIVGLGTIGDTFEHVVEAHNACIFADDYGIERVPLGYEVALLHLVAMLEVERATVWHVHRREHDVGVRVDEADFGQTADNHLAVEFGLVGLALGERNGTKLVELNLRVVLGNDAGIGCCVTSHTTGVEGTERKLCTRLTNGLGSNDSNSLAELYHACGGKVATVALHADTLLAFTGEHRTDFDALDGRVLDGLGLGFGNLLACGNDKVASSRMNDIVNGNTSKDALRE